MHCNLPRTVLAALAVGAATGCTDLERDMTAPMRPAASRGVAPPAPLVTIPLPSGSQTFWPFTGRSFVEPADPINLIFVGTAAPLALREALLSVDGDRSAFGLPPVAPFDCTWRDAIGGAQTAYAESGGWAGSAVQLECGGYGPVRFHVRLFELDGMTLGGAHFEVLIPGTADHEVLSWELAQQLVTIDFLRAGVLDPAGPVVPSAPITPVPSYRTIHPLIYNGLPAALAGAIGGPAQPVSEPVPIANDGSASILTVAKALPVVPMTRQTAFALEYDQVLPKPFCAAGPQDLVHVLGPVQLRQAVEVTAAGDFSAITRIEGRLTVTPLGGGAARTAEIERAQQALISPAGAQVDDRFRQVLRSLGDLAEQSSLVRLRTGPGNERYTSTVRCD